MSILRKLMGWRDIDDRITQIFKENKRLIMVFPHTTYYDFILYSLYFLENDILRRRGHALINPKDMDILGGILKKIGGIKATAREVHGGGCVKRIVDEFKDKEEFIILLSPKGSLDNYPWRTGFYWLAKLLDCKLVAGGFDYSKKKLIVKEPFSVANLSLEETEQRCKDDLHNIIPLYPNRSEFPLSDRVERVTPLAYKTSRIIGMILICIAVFMIIVLTLVYLDINRYKSDIYIPRSEYSRIT